MLFTSAVYDASFESRGKTVTNEDEVLQKAHEQSVRSAKAVDASMGETCTPAENGRIPKDVSYVANSSLATGCPELKYHDACKADMADFDIDR